MGAATEQFPEDFAVDAETLWECVGGKLAQGLARLEEMENAEPGSYRHSLAGVLARNLFEEYQKRQTTKDDS